MDIAGALRAAVAEAGWTPSKVAAETAVGEKTAQRWLSGESTPAGDKVITLQRVLPGFAERLGFVPNGSVRHAA